MIWESSVGYNWGFLILGILTRKPVPPGWRRVRFETKNIIVMSPAGLGSEKDCAGEAQQQV
jgi:hypothetical protein